MSRYAADQARRGTEAFLALRSEFALLRADIAGTTARVDALGENMAVGNAALTRHGRALDVLTQDVREIRQEQVAIRQEQVAMRSDMSEMNRKLDAVLAALEGGRPTA